MAYALWCINDVGVHSPAVDAPAASPTDAASTERELIAQLAPWCTAADVIDVNGASACALAPRSTKLLL
jgi:hypothetical protein